MDNNQPDSAVIHSASMLRNWWSARAKAPGKGRSRSITPFLLVIATTLTLVLVVDLAAKAPAFIGYTDGLGISERHELQPDSIDPAWIISGEPVVHTAVFERSPHWASSSGIWECIGPARFVWDYSVDETIYVLEGSADIEYMGKTFTLHAGDSTRFVAGTRATWTVNDRIKKTFRIQKPGRVIKAVRSFLRLVGFE